MAKVMRMRSPCSPHAAGQASGLPEQVKKWVKSVKSQGVGAGG